MMDYDNPARPPSVPFRPIGLRLVRIVATVAVFCALAAIALQTLFDIRAERAAFDARVREITATRLPMLSSALWDIEPRLAQSQINDIAAMPQISGATLVTAAGINLTAGELAPEPRKANADSVLDVMPPDGTGNALGQLYINFDHHYLVRRVLINTATTAAFVGVFTLILCVLLIRFLRAEVSIPLQRLLSHVNAMSPDALGVPFASGRTRRKWQDELDRLAQGYARLHGDIARYVDERNRAEAALAEQRDRLEVMVAARTRDLEEARNKADHASRSKSEFLANMSHEIRTPINAIAGFTTLALRTELTPKQADYLEKINGATQGLLRIISDLLDFSKIEAGHLDIEHIPFRLAEVMETTVTCVGATAERKGLELLIQVAPDMPTHWVGDPLRLNQILINLCSNAVKFTERGEVEVRVKLKSKTPGGARLLFAVRDTGIGLTPEQAGKLFQAFTQADTSTTRRFGGTGLGLVISQRLVRMMNGHIWLESEIGVGTTFFFEVELDAVDAASLPPMPELPPELIGRRALVVDDNANARQILCAQLAQLGMAPHAVENGEAALQELRRAPHGSQSYPLVLMDWKMPGMDGVAATRAIRSDPAIGAVPVIIMVTAYAREQVVNAIEDTRLFDDVLLKPVTSSVLIETLCRRRHEGNGAVAVKAEQGEQFGRLPGVRLLLVEDNPVNQQLAKELLEMEGAQVSIAANGRIALEVLQQAGLAHFDAVLLDLQMPEMDGYEAARRIRALPDNERLPLLAMTAHAMREERERCLALGMQDHLAKPVDPELLVAKLRQWIDPENLARAAAAAVPAEKPGAKKSPTDGVLPGALPGIDMQAALRRCGGNMKLLSELLAMFHHHYGDADAQIRRYWAEGRINDALRLAHTVKGAAANLGMRELAANAGALEQALKKTAEDENGLADARQAGGEENQ